MTNVDIVAEVERRLWPLDERTRKAVEIALEVASRPEAQVEPEWQGANPPCDEMMRLSEDERIRIMDALSDLNDAWLERKRAELGARWMLVVDGEVIAHGETWDNYPSDEEIEEMCHKTGKMILYYEPPPLIEESSQWRATVYSDDLYPTLSVAFLGNGHRAVTDADFDTGSPDVCVDAGLLKDNGVIRTTPLTLWRRSYHLGRDFWYVRRPVEVSLTAMGGSLRSTIHPILCVRHWNESPFVSMNPSRTALVGRDLCHQLQPTVALNFARHETTVQW